MNKPHKHAQLAMQYAQDMLDTETPWDRWQYKYNSEEWKDSDGPLHFYSDFQYRRKPRTININGIYVPEPMREKPDEGTYYWHPLISSAGASCRNMWEDNDWHIVRFENGMCHLTREAAELHAKALLSFTKKEETK